MRTMAGSRRLLLRDMRRRVILHKVKYPYGAHGNSNSEHLCQPHDKTKNRERLPPFSVIKLSSVLVDKLQRYYRKECKSNYEYTEISPAFQNVLCR